MWTYRAVLLDMYDADTLTVLADLGFHARHEVDVRLAGVSAPELRDSGGAEARDWARSWMTGLPPVRWPLLVRTEINTLVEPDQRRSFTRYIADVWDIHGIRYLNADLRGFLAEHPEWGPGS